MRPQPLLAALAALALAGLASPARAAAPCWQKLLNDYYDNGRIDHVYTAACYTQAIQRIPRPLRDYSDAYDVLTRNLQLATSGHPGRRRQDLLVAPSTSPPSPPGGSTSRSSAPFSRVADTGGGGATTVPLPLLVLAGLGLALTVAGAAAALVRRRRG